MSSERARALAAKADDRLAVVLRRADAAPAKVLDVAYEGRKVGDVLAHLYAWQVTFDSWVAQERAGSVPAFPAEGYTWSDLKSLNDAFYQAHRERPYEAVRSMLLTSHASMLRLLDTFTEEELTDEARYPWLGGQSLGDVADECLGEHYEWALRTFDAAGMA